MELTQAQQHSRRETLRVRLLRMSTPELNRYLRELAEENPMVELEESEFHELHEKQPEDDLTGRMQWLEDNDHQNHYYQHMDDSDLDPMTRVGTWGGLEETLPRFVSRQLDGIDLDRAEKQAVRYLASCLDARGYLRTRLEELARDGEVPLERLELALRVLRSLEPAGIGARSLSDCLELQLLRIQETGPALQIVRSELENLAKHHYQAIASRLNISLEEVRQAQRIIRELEPRPGAIFEQPEQVAYILPDIFVEEEGGAYTVRPRTPGGHAFQINGYYRDLLRQSEQAEVRDYLEEKLQQAQDVLWALGQREQTLLRCAQAIVDLQGDFFREGPAALTPLRIFNVTKRMQVPESTVKYAVREKYLQCARGLYPLSYFFSAKAKRVGEESGGAAARQLLRQLIEQEQSPLSDDQLSRLLSEQGYPISRCKVAKYRNELNIPDASDRKKRDESLLL